VYLRWGDVQARIVRPNILATNGIIHVVDRLLVTTPRHVTTPAPTTTTPRPRVNLATPSSQRVVIVTSLCDAFLVLLFVQLLKVFAAGR